MRKSIDVKEIIRYSYFIFSSRSTEVETKAVIILTGKDEFLGYIYFMKNGIELPKTEKINGLFFYYYYFSEMPVMIDLLRNEKPVYLIYIDDDKNNSRISSAMEPVGEGEE